MGNMNIGVVKTGITESDVTALAQSIITALNGIDPSLIVSVEFVDPIVTVQTASGAVTAISNKIGASV